MLSKHDTLPDAVHSYIAVGHLSHGLSSDKDFNKSKVYTKRTRFLPGVYCALARLHPIRNRSKYFAGSMRLCCKDTGFAKVFMNERQ